MTKAATCAPTLVGLDLRRGALGIDHVNGRQIMIKPCGDRGSYVGWCHIIITSYSDDDGSVRRTREAVHESEIVAWLRMPGGIDADRFEWYPGSWEPTPDTYRVDEFLRTKEKKAKR